MEVEAGNWYVGFGVYSRLIKNSNKIMLFSYSPCKFRTVREENDKVDSVVENKARVWFEDAIAQLERGMWCEEGRCYRFAYLTHNAPVLTSAMLEAAWHRWQAELIPEYRCHHTFSQ